ncbi:unnamed protein product [Closterium sp. NIES-53]
MSFAATAATLRRELQQQRARQLYRRSLKNTLSWAIFRDIYYDEASFRENTSFPFFAGQGSASKQPSTNDLSVFASECFPQLPTSHARAIAYALLRVAIAFALMSCGRPTSSARCSRRTDMSFPSLRLLLLIVLPPSPALPSPPPPAGQSDADRIDRLLAAGEAKLKENQHPDPYLVPWLYGGSKFARNLSTHSPSSLLPPCSCLLPPVLLLPPTSTLPTAVPWVYGGSKYALNPPFPPRTLLPLSLPPAPPCSPLPPPCPSLLFPPFPLHCSAICVWRIQVRSQPSLPPRGKQRSPYSPPR